MKNKISKTIFLKLIYNIIICAIIVTTIIFIISKLDFQWLFNISPNLYYNLSQIFYSLINNYQSFLFLFFIWNIVILIIFYLSLKKFFNTISETIARASREMFDDDIEYIKLPKEFEILQHQMNHLKRESEKNALLAKESEQKKDDLIVYLAHDLKTPLTSMIGYLSLLDEVKDLPKNKHKKYINIALQKSYKLEELINELFEITRFNSETIILEKEKINLRLMLEQIIDDFYPILKENGKNIELNQTAKIILLGDPDRLARVFSNLIKNAIYYSTDNKITINVLKDEKNISIIFVNKASKLTPEKLDRIFEKFYRVEDARTSKSGGSGLGLAISKEIIELHNGSISATKESDYIKITVTLPLSES